MNENEYEINTHKKRLDLAMIHNFLANKSYWAKGIPFEVMKKSIEGALCLGVYHQGKQVGSPGLSRTTQRLPTWPMFLSSNTIGAGGWENDLSKPSLITPS